MHYFSTAYQLKKGLTEKGRVEMIRRIKINLKYIFTKFTLIVSIVFGIISGIQIFADWNTIGIKDTKNKILILLALLLLCGVIAFIWGGFLSNKRTIYSRDEVEINVKYGDLMKISFPKKNVEERIVVIAVNQCFDTIVDQNVIREASVHGQFIKNYVHNISDLHKLDIEIKDSLSEFGYEYTLLKRDDKLYGKLDRYPRGSIARINGDNGVTFFLLALTGFDRNCKAHCNKREYVESVLKLFEYYDSHGQGKELYLYPMGTGMARTGLSKKEALESIITLTKISKEHLRSKTTIIVDKRCKNDISITEF